MSLEIGNRQLEILRVLWDRGEASVNEVQEALGGDEANRPAYTTVATLLSRMEAKGSVTRRTVGRTFVYSPAVREESLNKSMVGRLIDELFGGSPAQLVSHLLERRDVDAAELARIRELVEQHETSSRSRKPGS